MKQKGQWTYSSALVSVIYDGIPEFSYLLFFGSNHKDKIFCTEILQASPNLTNSVLHNRLTYLHMGFVFRHIMVATVVKKGLVTV